MPRRASESIANQGSRGFNLAQVPGNMLKGPEPGCDSVLSNSETLGLDDTLDHSVKTSFPGDRVIPDPGTTRYHDTDLSPRGAEHADAVDGYSDEALYQQTDSASRSLQRLAENTDIENSEMAKAHYKGTGLSDDGRSLTPDPHSSEAETEHLASSDDEISGNNHQEGYGALVANKDYDNYEQSDVIDDEIPADLDALSDTGSFAGTIQSRDDRRVNDDDDVEDNQRNDDEDDDVLSDGSGSLDVLDANDNHENDDEDEKEINSQLDRAEALLLPDASTAEDDFAIDASGMQNGANSPEFNIQDATNQPSPGRKRKRSLDVSPSNTKRLAPRRVQAELDSDEEDGETGVVSGSTEFATPPNAITVTPVLEEDPGDQIEVLQESLSNKQIGNGTFQELEAEDDVEDEVEDDEVEEEIQDDTEREERNKHRQAAMEALRQIEVEFAQLRSKLYEERMNQIDREITLAETGEHPLLIEKTLQNRSRHTGRLRRAEILRDRRAVESDLVVRARRFGAHSQFAQDKQKLRATLLSKTSAEWFQIHREKRVIDMAVPEYGYIVPERRSIQAKQRREHEAEISVLTGLKKFVGFPAAPVISVASLREIETDLAEMGIFRSIGINHRESQSQRVTNASNQHVATHSHVSMSSHLAHHSHPAHPHNNHQPSLPKSHHRKQHPVVLHSTPDHPDHHAPVHHGHDPSPQIPGRQTFHTHTFHEEPNNRKVTNLPATFGSSHEPERKHSQSVQFEKRNPDLMRERPPFSSHTLPPPPGNFHNQSGPHSMAAQFGQKQAQNLPNILRQDISDLKTKQMPNMSQLNNGGRPNSQDFAGVNSNKSSFAAQFWSPKPSESSRPPAPAMSSNSAFNATLSQPGSSASYIPPPRTYSPAGQSQNGIFKPPQMHSSQQGSNKPFHSANQYPAQQKGSPPQNNPSFYSGAALAEPAEQRNVGDASTHPRPQT